MHHWFSISFIYLTFEIFVQGTYKAAVVDYTAAPTVEENIQLYVDFIKQAGSPANPTDIIIFPQNTLTVDMNKVVHPEHVPNPLDQITPHSDPNFQGPETKAIRAISGAAAEHKIYVVINIDERGECTPTMKHCPARGYFHYKTDAVFDRTGTVIARYRKVNGIGEKDADVPKRPDYAVFQTDFGEAFGLISSTDILFRTPSVELVQNIGLTNIILTDYWINELPFLISAQIHSGWSYALNVTLLASGANKPSDGITGCGVYTGRIGFNCHVAEREINGIIGESIPSKQIKFGSGWMALYRNSKVHKHVLSSQLNPVEDTSLPFSTGRVLNLNTRRFTRQLCNRGLCCNFDIIYRRAVGRYTANHYTYQAVVYKGPAHLVYGEIKDVVYCAVVLCTAGNCAKKPQSDDFPIIFEKIHIYGQFSNINAMQIPSTLRWISSFKEIVPFQPMSYDMFHFDSTPTNDGSTSNVNIYLDQARNDLVTFGIYGRDFK